MGGFESYLMKKKSHGRVCVHGPGWDRRREVYNTLPVPSPKGECGLSRNACNP